MDLEFLRKRLSGCHTVDTSLALSVPDTPRHHLASQTHRQNQQQQRHHQKHHQQQQKQHHQQQNHHQQQQKQHHQQQNHHQQQQKQHHQQQNHHQQQQKQHQQQQKQHHQRQKQQEDMAPQRKRRHVTAVEEQQPRGVLYPALTSDGKQSQPLGKPAADYLLLYKCHVCGKAFSKPQSLGGHMRSHPGNKGAGQFFGQLFQPANMSMEEDGPPPVTSAPPATLLAKALPASMQLQPGASSGETNSLHSKPGSTPAEINSLHTEPGDWYLPDKEPKLSHGHKDLSALLFSPVSASLKFLNSTGGQSPSHILGPGTGVANAGSSPSFDSPSVMLDEPDADFEAGLFHGDANQALAGHPAKTAAFHAKDFQGLNSFALLQRSAGSLDAATCASFSKDDMRPVPGQGIMSTLTGKQSQHWLPRIRYSVP